MQTINEENYFDYSEAIYTYCSLNHEGMWSDEYLILSQLSRYFKPGLLFSESIVEKENPIYDEITKENVVQLFEELLKFLDERE